MGKQTKIKGSNFGGPWTKQKLNIIDKYLKFYSTVLKNQNVKKIYVDAFAGSGKTYIKDKPNIEENKLLLECFEEGAFSEKNENVDIDGSALISLKYDFDVYIFCELNEDRLSNLKELVNERYPKKFDKTFFVKNDANVLIESLVSKYIKKYDRCLMFLDPFALELKWSSLEKISKCEVIDLWYLFPLSVNRLLPLEYSNLTNCFREHVTRLLGTTDWEKEIYYTTKQYDLFGVDTVTGKRIPHQRVIEYIKNRFKILFPYVETKVLRNEKKAPLFLLSFMMTNKSPKALAAAKRGVQAVFKETESII